MKKAKSFFSNAHHTLPGLFILICMMVVAGCSDDFLDRSPKGQLTYDTFFQTKDHAIWATNAIYQQYRNWDLCSFPWIGLTDILSDDADKGSTPTDALYMQELDDFTFNSTNSAITGAWSGHYQLIFRANLAIDNIPNIDMDPVLRDRLIGEARFLRAYAYFRLVQWFGDIPLIAHTLSDNQYYNQVRLRLHRYMISSKMICFLRSAYYLKNHNTVLQTWDALQKVQRVAYWQNSIW